MTGRFEHFDARPGGSYRLVLAYADASAAREARGKSAVDSDVVDAMWRLERACRRATVPSGTRA